MNGSVESGLTDDLLFGSSDAMRPLRRQIETIADTGLPVLIEGENGAGKTLLARTLHARSSRASRAFITINCSTIGAAPPLDEVLFGKHDMSARPNDRSNESLSQALPGSILFHDIGELALSVQSQLISLLQDARLSDGAGGVQIICTTKRPLVPQLAAGTLRADLYYSINVLHISLPPLRERRADIPALAFHFLKLYSEAYQRHPGPFPKRLLDALIAADWPGNIRELENTVKRYVVLGSVEPILAELQKELEARPTTGPPSQLSLKALRRNAMRDCEYNLILSSLNRNQWNRRRTAQELQISYRSLLYIMAQLGLPKKRNDMIERLPSNPNYAT